MSKSTYLLVMRHGQKLSIKLRTHVIMTVRPHEVDDVFNFMLKK